MSNHTFDLGSQLERLMNDRRVRIGGLVVGALIVAVSLGVVNASQTHRSSRSVEVLPDRPLNIPVIRQWPYPTRTEVLTVRAPASKVVAKRVLTARR